ncbi:MAG: peptidylprolyl isomerase [Phycisphaerae bacterium]|nr:peptidylprolyl isomerase [Phycisphaerae bacterium]
MRILKGLGVAALISFWTTAALGQAPPTTRPAETDQPKPTTLPAADSVAAIVNGEPVMESDIDKWFMPRMRMQGVNDEMMQQLRPQFRPRALKEVINHRLLIKEAERAGIKITKEDLVKAVEKDLDKFLEVQGFTREEYEQKLLERTKKSLQEHMEGRMADPAFQARFLHAKLIEKKYPDKLKVTEKDVREHYEENLERQYSKPAQVRASHILFGKAGMTEEEKAAAKKEAVAALPEVKRPGADFAALAMKYSSCPSKKKGGDLDFFPRHNKMTEPFAKVAFELKVGQISDIVESQFGYHIIKVTDRTEAVITPYEEVKDQILKQLTYSRPQDLIKQYAEELRAEAKIEYPPGKEPKTAAPPARSPVKPAPQRATPTTQPAPKK